MPRKKPLYSTFRRLKLNYLSSETSQVPGQRRNPKLLTETMILCCLVRAIAHRVGAVIDEYGAMMKW
jgi:hypothetical protein